MSKNLKYLDTSSIILSDINLPNESILYEYRNLSAISTKKDIH